MTAPGVISVTALLALAVAAAPALACRITGDELLNPVWVGARSDKVPEAEVEVVGFVRRVEKGETRYGDAPVGRPWVLMIETIRTVRGETRPEWSVALHPSLPPAGPPDLGEGPYRFAFDLPETVARAAAPGPVWETRLPGSDAVLPHVGMRLCGHASIFPVSPYAPDVLIARVFGASAAPFVAGLGLLAGGAILARRRRRRA